VFLKKIFPEIKIDSWENRTAQSRIIISTSKILSSLYNREKFDLGFILDIDAYLSRLDYQETFSAYLYVRKLSSMFRDKLYVFTRNHSHYLFKSLARQWEYFYDKELSLRAKLNLPPFGSITKIILRGKEEKNLLKNSQKIYNILEKEGLSVYGPFHEHPFKLRGNYRYSLIIKSKRGLINSALRGVIDKLRTSNLKLAVIVK